MIVALALAASLTAAPSAMNSHARLLIETDAPLSATAETLPPPKNDLVGAQLAFTVVGFATFSAAYLSMVFSAIAEVVVVGLINTVTQSVPFISVVKDAALGLIPFVGPFVGENLFLDPTVRYVLGGLQFVGAALILTAIVLPAVMSKPTTERLTIAPILSPSFAGAGAVFSF